MRALYDVGFFFFALFYLPAFAAKGKFGKGALSRFGILSPDVRRRLEGARPFWVHAVSVGEMGLAVRWVESLRRRWPGKRFLITTTTVTGYAVGEKLKSAQDILLYFPLDFRPCVSAFISAVRPCAAALLETEIWPNLIAELKKRNIPAFIVNGRLSDKSIRRYRRIKRWLGNTLNDLSGVGVQDELMRARFAELGLRPEKIEITGNLKYDWKPPAEDGRAPRSDAFFWVAGSTHAGEEEALLRVFRSMKQKGKKLRLVLAPRHLHRLTAVEKTAADLGLDMRRLVWAEARAGWLGDLAVVSEMGVLPHFYEAADAVFIGGSLVPFGGHNPVEAAYYEKPVLFGPHMQNFQAMADEFKAARAAVAVRNAEDLETKMEEFIRRPDLRAEYGHRAKQLVLRHQGASEKSAQFLERRLHEIRDCATKGIEA